MRCRARKKKRVVLVQQQPVRMNCIQPKRWTILFFLLHYVIIFIALSWTNKEMVCIVHGHGYNNNRFIMTTTRHDRQQRQNSQYKRNTQLSSLLLLRTTKMNSRKKEYIALSSRRNTNRLAFHSMSFCRNNNDRMMTEKFLHPSLFTCCRRTTKNRISWFLRDTIYPLENNDSDEKTSDDEMNKQNDFSTFQTDNNNNNFIENELGLSMSVNDNDTIIPNDYIMGGIDITRTTTTKQIATKKSTLYSDVELQNLLSLHNQITNDMALTQPPSPLEIIESSLTTTTGNEFDNLPSLHELVLDILKQQEEEEVKEVRTLKDDTNSITTESDNNNNNDTSNYFQFNDPSFDLDAKKKGIRAIASDVDGTLLSSNQTMHPLTFQSVQEIVSTITGSSSSDSKIQHFFLATGKSRSGALNSLGPEMKELLQHSPGVFIQGLYCVNENNTVIYERKLPSLDNNIIIQAVEQLAIQHNVTMLAYDGDVLYANCDANVLAVQQVHEKWGEPVPVQMTKKQSLASNCVKGYHKILFMDYCDDSSTNHMNDHNKMNSLIRPQLQLIATKYNCVVTQAIPTMLELLPGNCSKAVGVRQLCEYYNITMGTELLSIGDAENDIDMLKQSAIGITVANACELAKNVSDIIMFETNDEGGAGRAFQLFSKNT